MDKGDALVKNAGDEKQVKRAEKKEKLGRDQELSDIRNVLDSKAGRRFVWRIMSHCNPFGSVKCPNYGDTYYLSGKQDVGHFLLAEITEADEMILGKLMMENYNKGEN